MGVTLFSFFLSCQKEISVEYGEPAKGSLQSSAGDCLPKLVAGSYIANKALNDSNFLEVTVNVTTPGPYTIYTDTANGYSFRASGTFANTGTNTVRLKGSGMPAAAGIDDFMVVFDSSICFVDVTVLPSGSTGGPAVFTLLGAPGGCAAFGLVGNYYKDTTLDARHKVTVNVNVTTVGTYTINTNTQNGYFFSATGSFGATGPHTITLNGSGKPAAVGTDNFTVTAGSATCTFPVTVTTPAASGNCVATFQGTYTAGTATTTANKVILTHTYATAGSYNITTTPVNGYSFGLANYVATAGANTVTLTATGTPLVAGTNTFTVNFGDGQTCTFTVTVSSGTTPPINTDYFPIAANNWWSYDYTGGPPDTMIMKVTGPATVGGQAYQRFEWSSPAAGPFAEYFYRKDASNGFYYEGIDTTGFGPEVIFTNTGSLHLNILRNTLTTGQTWTSTEYPVILNITGYSGPSVLRYKYTCDNSNATLTSATGRTINNVYQVTSVLQANIGGQFVDVGDLIKTYYARGIGQVKYLNDSDPADIYQETIRNWQVN